VWLVVAREQATEERTRTINTLSALVRTVDLGVERPKALTARQITMIAAWRDRDEEATTATCRREAVRLARRVRTLDEDLARSRADITELITQDTPQLLELSGVGAVVAASVLIAWSRPGRVRSEAAMATLAGTCPTPASSGNTVRHRLNRGGDRRLNRALTTITIVRMRIDPTTRGCVARRRAEGRTTKEIMRSLKRYITRQLFRTSPQRTRSPPPDRYRSIPGVQIVAPRDAKCPSKRWKIGGYGSTTTSPASPGCCGAWSRDNWWVARRGQSVAALRRLPAPMFTATNVATGWDRHGTELVGWVPAALVGRTLVS